MLDDFFHYEPTVRGTLGVSLKWVAVAMVLLCPAILLNMGSDPSTTRVTLVGIANNPSSDFIELEAEVATHALEDRTVRLRINRSVEVRGVTGIAYRSFDGTARVDCHARQALYTQTTYYTQPNFKGTPVSRRRWSRHEQMPVQLRGFDQAYVRRVVELGCM